MALIDMKYTKAERKAEAAEANPGEGQDYPWGLCIRLESEELDKLGVAALPDVGGEVHFTAVAKVTGVNQSSSVTQAPETSVALQITMLQIDEVESAEEEKGEKETPAAEKSEAKTARKGGVLGY